MEFENLDQRYGILRLPSQSEIPTWVYSSFFYSISKSENELSILCEYDLIPTDHRPELIWKGFRVKGELDFGLTGILNQITKPLAEIKIPIFAISTFDTDYIFLQEDHFQRGITTLNQLFS